MSERERFEKWFKKEYGVPADDTDIACHHWKTWKAAAQEDAQDARRWQMHKRVMDEADEFPGLVNMMFEATAAEYEASIDAAIAETGRGE